MTESSLREYFSSSVFIRDGASDDCSFDELLGYYDYSTWEGSYRKTARIRLKNILRYQQPPARLLEIGPATGFFLEQARSLGFEVRGLDVSSSFAATAREKELEIDVGFVESYPLPTASYDIICCFGGITCWYDPLAGLANVRQALKKSGLFAVNYMDVDNLFHKIQGRRNWDYVHTCLTLWSATTMRHGLEQSSFDVLFLQSERQSVSLGRLSEYLRLRFLRAMVHSLKLNELSLRIIVPFTKFALCRPA